MTQWDKPMNFIEFWAIRSQALRDLKLTPAEWFQFLAGHLDTTGTPQAFLNSDGDGKVVDQAQEGFFGLRGKNPGDILVAGDAVTTDGSGNFAASDITAASPGAAEKIRVLGVCFIGPEDANGTADVVCGAVQISSGEPFGGANRTSGPWVPCNALGAANSEVSWSGAGLAVSEGYGILIAYRVEDA